MALLLSPFALASDATAQDDVTTLSANWQQLDAASFIAQVDGVLGKVSIADRVAVSEHAWKQFLNDESFVDSGDWKVVEPIVYRFAERGADRAAAGTAQATVERELAALHQRVKARLAADASLVNKSSFAELKHLALGLTDSGVSYADVAPYYAQWMAANDWQSLPLKDLATLFGELGGSEQVTSNQMSARWTGTVSAPADGEYTFELVRQYIHDPSFKLWINGQLVQDSSENSDSGAEFFTSKPVRMSAKTPVSIKLEMVNQTNETGYSRGSAAAALLWRTDQASPSLCHLLPSHLRTVMAKERVA